MAPSKPKVKAKVSKRKITFMLNDDHAMQVAVAGDFNNWSPTSHLMKKNIKGVWEKSVFLETGRYEYKFLVDGEWQSDPKNSQLSRNSFGTTNNVLMVTQP
jgi:1,4-alpha-glucan branching enzyme